MGNEIVLGVAMFTGVIMLLVFVILYARRQLVSTGEVTIEINGDPDKTLRAPAGSKLLNTLADAGIFLSSACGGGGTCAQCRCRVLEGGGSMLSTEEGHFTRGEAKKRVALKLSDSSEARFKNRGPTRIFWCQTVGM